MCSTPVGVDDGITGTPGSSMLRTACAQRLSASMMESRSLTHGYQADLRCSTPVGVDDGITEPLGVAAGVLGGGSTPVGVEDGITRAPPYRTARPPVALRLS